MLPFTQALGQNIGYLVMCGDVFQFDIFRFDFLSQPVILNVKVLGRHAPANGICSTAPSLKGELMAGAHRAEWRPGHAGSDDQSGA